ADEPLGIYLRGTTVAEGVTGRGTSDDTVAWIAFRADLDLGKEGGPASYDDLFAVFDTANVPTPTYWQHSGGGFYPTWLLAEPVQHAPEVENLAADIEAELRRAWNAAGYTSGVDSCHDAARVWRLAGSVHRKNRDRPITSTTGKFSGELHTFDELRRQVPHRERPKAWDGRRSDPRYGYAEDFWKTYRESLRNCIDRGRGEFRHTFFLAARNGHRMVNLGLITPEQMRDHLLQLVEHYWPGMGFNGDDRQHIHDALNNPIERGEHAGALASPWVLKTPPEVSAALGSSLTVPGQTLPQAPAQEAQEGELVADGERQPVPQPPQQPPHLDEELMLQVELMRRRVKRRADEIERPPALPISEGLLSFDQLDEIEPPAMLVKRLIPERAVGFLNGRSGSYKSFVLVALAVSLATGRPVMGHREFDVARPVKVLYVAAEGSAGVALRMRAYARRHGIREAPNLTLYPRAVNLTSPREMADLEHVVAEGGYEFLLVDTFRQATLGINESDNSELS